MCTTFSYCTLPPQNRYIPSQPMSQSSLRRSQSALGRGRSANASVVHGRLLQPDAHLHPDTGEHLPALRNLPALEIPGSGSGTAFYGRANSRFADHADGREGGRDAGCPAGLAEVSSVYILLVFTGFCWKIALKKGAIYKLIVPYFSKFQLKINILQMLCSVRRLVPGTARVRPDVCRRSGVK